VTAAVPGTVVDPVRVHPPPAQPALHQARQHVPAGRTVLAFPRRTKPLNRDEVRLADQPGVRQSMGLRPLTRHRRPPALRPAALPTPHLPSRVTSGAASTSQAEIPIFMSRK
jgi:hypothetical protein